MMGAFGSTLIFIVTLIVSTMLGVSLIAYAAHCLLVVVTDTAAGLDEVKWPGDLIIDWILSSLRLVGLVFIVMIPVGLLGRIAGAGPYLLLAGPLWFWLFFPIGLLSSMSVGSLFAVLRPTILLNLLRILPSTLVFYFLSALVLGGCGALWFLTLIQGMSWLVSVASVASAAGVLIYARLLGRLGWLVSRLAPLTAVKRAPGKLKPQLRKKMIVEDPWTAPSPKPAKAKRSAPAEKPIDLPVEGYGLSDEPLCQPPQFVLRTKETPYLDVKDPIRHPRAPEPPEVYPRPFDEDDGPLPEMEPESALPGPESRRRIDVAPSALDMRIAQHDEQHEPAFAFFSGVWSFPMRGLSLGAMFKLSLGFIVLGLLIARLTATAPGS